MLIQNHIKKMWWQPYFKELSNKIYQAGKQAGRKEAVEDEVKFLEEQINDYKYSGFYLITILRRRLEKLKEQEK